MNNFKRRVNVIDWHGVYGCFLLCIMGLIGVLTKEKGCYSIATRNKSIMSERLTQFKGKVEEKATRAARVLVPIAGAGIVGGVSEFVPTGAPTDVAALILGGAAGYGVNSLLDREGIMGNSGRRVGVGLNVLAGVPAAEIVITHGPTVPAIILFSFAAVGGATRTLRGLGQAIRSRSDENSGSMPKIEVAEVEDPLDGWRKQAAKPQEDPREPHPFGGDWSNH